MKSFGKIFSAAGVALAIMTTALIVRSCGIYSFSGTSIQPDIKTVTINYFEYKALKVNPTLSNSMTESLKDKFRKMTRLEQVDMDGDLEITGSITGYDVRAMAVTANEVAAQNRLTVTVKIDFTNRKYPEDDFRASLFLRMRIMTRPSLWMRWKAHCATRSLRRFVRMCSMRLWRTGRIWSRKR